VQADAKRDLPGPEQPQFHAASPPSAPSTSTQQQAGLRDVPTTAENVSRKHNTKYDNYAKTDHEIFRALHLFSGRSDRKDGLATLLKAQGWECEDIDIVNASLPGEQRSDHDLIDDELWLSIRKWLLDGEYDFVWLGTPCATFSAARWQIIPGNPNAPRSLRDFCYPWGYNGPTVDDDAIPHLTTKEKEDLKQGNIFAQKSAEIFELCRSLGIPVALDNPSPRPDIKLYRKKKTLRLPPYESIGIPIVRFKEIHFHYGNIMHPDLIMLVHVVQSSRAQTVRSCSSASSNPPEQDIQRS
jgi:hypothetical protein